MDRAEAQEHLYEYKRYRHRPKPFYVGDIWNILLSQVDGVFLAGLCCTYETVHVEIPTK